MTPEQAFQYIGLPWEQKGNGPDSWNCWNLSRHILKVHFNKEVPMIGMESGDELRAMYKDKLDSGSWIKREIPQHGYGALMKGGMHPHVGVYLDIDGGGIIHSLEGAGVVFTPVNATRMLGFGKIEYYEII